jgi:hypothetical protein
MVGGARLNSGRLPDMNSARTLKRVYDDKTFTRLPKECTKEVPDWPDSVENPSVQELGFWNELWHMPQAHIWHADRMAHSIALYVRIFCEASRPKASSQKQISVRQMADTLYLSSPSLRAARFVIVESPEDEVLQELIQARLAATGTDGPTKSRAGRPRPSSKDRLGVSVIHPARNEDEIDPDSGDDE